MQVNYSIGNPTAFNDFILKELAKEPNGKNNISTLTEQGAVEASANIVKKHLKEAKSSGASPSDTTPIDKLIMTGMNACCRHFTAATKVVFEQIQTLAEKNSNTNLKDTVVFENTNPAIAHATLGIARGNNVTTIDTYWAKKNEDGSVKQDSLDSTFDGKHSNVTSLYSTLSKNDSAHPENKIFDAGHSEQVMDQFGKDVSKVTNISEIDDQLQTVIYKADQISCRESLQTPEKLTKVSEELGIISTDILNKCIGVETFNIAPVYKLMLESILQIGVVLNKVIQEKFLAQTIRKNSNL